ncbi:MAG: MarR family transcriptional regulator [Candidatus Methanoperedenaceae archaeon]|nr:MarR family transcriptional regulator [Candidatus Methanoperedenaceae archaeon]
MRVEGRAFCMVMLTVSAFVLSIKVLAPTTIQIFMQGEITTLKQVPNIYTLFDIIVVAIFSGILGISASYLLFFESRLATGYELVAQNHKAMAGISLDNELLAKLPNQNDTGEQALLKILKGNECEVAKALLEFGELNQAELASKADIPKSTLSRILADLEKRGVIIRYENGMSKMVKLSDALQK